MASIRKNINGALKMLGIVGGHGATATNEELVDALEAVHGLYHMMLTNGTFGRIRDVYPKGDYILGENQRVTRRCNSLQEIRIPDMVSSCGSYGFCLSDETADGYKNRQNLPTTDYGAFPTRTRHYNERRGIRDLSVAVIVDEVSGSVDELIYDGHQKKWFVISDMDHDFDLTDEHDVNRLNAILDEEAPLSQRDTIGFRSWIAMQIAGMFSAEITEMIARNAANFERSLGVRMSESEHCMFDPHGAGAVGDSYNCRSKEPVDPVVPAEPEVENLIVIDRAGTTTVQVSGTDQVDLIFIVEETFELISSGGVLYFTPAHAGMLAFARRRWVLKDISDNTVLESGFIEAKGFAV